MTVLVAKLAKGQYGKSVLEQLHSDENMKIMHIRFRFFFRLDLSIGWHHHCYGVLDLLRVSNSAELKSVLLHIFQGAPESITKCLPSGFCRGGCWHYQKLRQESGMCLLTPF